MSDISAIHAGPQPELTDGTVTLTALRDTDAPALVTCDNDRQTARWFGWPVGASTVENTSAFVGLAARRWPEGERATWATRDQASGEPLGTVELNLSDHAHVNVSYTTFPIARRRGLAARAVDLACRFAFAHLGVHRVQLLADAENAASLRVAAKAGFTREGVLRDYGSHNAEHRDMVMHSRLATDPDPDRTAL